jgi:hypothetical protein
MVIINQKRLPLVNTSLSSELNAYEGIRVLTELCGSDAQKKGWHEDRPEDPTLLKIWQGNKLMLMVSELVEAHDEIRTGHTADDTYYPEPPLPSSLVAEVGVTKARELITADNKGKAQKPEGVPSELADTVIRIFDFCYTEKIDLGAMIQEKLEYNRTRAYKHGKQF